MQKVILASGNAGKLKEMRAILSAQNMEVLSQKDFFQEEAKEDGLSFIENAIIKARFASQKTGLPAIADDSGIEVTALNGQPGIYSARYSGENATDASNNEKLLADLAPFSGEDRKACYYCAMVYVAHAEDPTPIIGVGRWCGQVMAELRGEGGFGYDPLIWIEEKKCSAAELPKEVKNRISHRAQALASLIKQLEVKV